MMVVNGHLNTRDCLEENDESVMNKGYPEINTIPARRRAITPLLGGGVETGVAGLNRIASGSGGFGRLGERY